MLAEIQALVSSATSDRPRRTTAGVDNARTSMIVAVLQQRGGVKVDGRDVFVSTVGGARVTEPAGDLAIALSIASGESLVASTARSGWWVCRVVRIDATCSGVLPAP